MTDSFSVKLKSKNGQFIVKDLNVNTSLAEFVKRVVHLTDIREDQLHILMGFPPRPLDLQNRDAGRRTLQMCGIQKGETLIVEEKSSTVMQQQQPLSEVTNSTNSMNINVRNTSPSIEDDEALARRLQAEEDQQVQEMTGARSPPPSVLNAGDSPDLHPRRRNNAVQLPLSASGRHHFNGILLKRVVPADNSCLFSSIRFVLNGKIDNEGSEMMRQIIAQEVAADPQQYNDAMLGKSNPEYCAWIQKPDSWGGAIEVAILSNYYGVEIDVVDIQNAIINRFGEDRNYAVRVFLLFDGIHYDPLYMETETVRYICLQIIFSISIVFSGFLSSIIRMDLRLPNSPLMNWVFINRRNNWPKKQNLPVNLPMWKSSLCAVNNVMFYWSGNCRRLNMLKPLDIHDLEKSN